jgi:hypothetical protein
MVDDLEFLTLAYKGMKDSSSRGDKGSPGDGFVPLMVGVKNHRTTDGPNGWGFIVFEGVPTTHLADALAHVRAEEFDGQPAFEAAVLADAYTAAVDERHITPELTYVEGMSPEQRFRAGDMSVTEALHINYVKADGSWAVRSIRYRLDDHGMPVYEEPDDTAEKPVGRVPAALEVLVTP